MAIASEPGIGTEITLYLPAANDRSETFDKKSAAPIDEGKGQTVLVVEDDDAVRMLICEVLSEVSYTRIQADDSIPAISYLASNQTIDLIVSDVGLPSMNGRQLADVARQHRPDLPVLIVTGYAENAATKAGFLSTDMDIIAKPFAVETLSTEVNKLMARQP